MRFLVGKKIGMTGIYNKGILEAATLILAEPCFVAQLKNEEKEGYMAVKLAYEKNKKKDGRIIGILKKADLEEKLGNFIELRVTDLTNFKIGGKIDISQFKKGDNVNISGISYGKGFAGVMKRHHFKGAPHSHGHKHDWRAPGSIGGGQPQHTLKGRRMAGRMGGDRVTVRNLSILEVDAKENILAVKGAIPGKANSWVKIFD